MESSIITRALGYFSSASRILPRYDSDSDSTSLLTLPSDLRIGLSVVTSLGFVSFFASLSLCVLLTVRIFKSFRKTTSTNQLVLLIYNLFLADLQQSIAFILNANWLAKNGINVTSKSCWAQGWFISTGDIASGAFCLFIATHTLFTIVLQRRISNSLLTFLIISTWVLVYFLAIIGVVIHPNDIYVRAVSWCWINSKYGSLRIWLHFFWIFVFEFGTVIIYIAIYFILRIRVKSEGHSDNATAPSVTTNSEHTRATARLMLVYPIIYVICTLPLAAIRLVSVTRDVHLDFPWFCFAGAMMTSNGWLDVLVYTFTRRVLLLADSLAPPEAEGLNTFWAPFSGNSGGGNFGNETVCEFSPTTSQVGRFRFSTSSRLGKSWKSIDDSTTSHLSSGHHSLNTTRISMTKEIGDASPSSSRDSCSPISNFDFIPLAVNKTTTYEVKSEPLIEFTNLNEVRTLRNTYSSSEKTMPEFETVHESLKR